MFIKSRHFGFVHNKMDIYDVILDLTPKLRNKTLSKNKKFRINDANWTSIEFSVSFSY